VSFQFIVLIVMSVIALVRVYGGSAGPQAVHTTWHFFMRGLFPLLGGIGMAAVFIKSAIDMVNPDYGFTTFGTIGGVFVIGVGVLALGVPLMIACAVRLRAFFRGETLNEETPILVPETGDLPAALSE
jgi:hypothetical protein